jgi:curved DNA-binding protein CbpA
MIKVQGIGFPHSSRQLAIIPPNKNDSAGYYAELGLDPDANRQQIKDAYRRLARKYHPEGSAPDSEKFHRLTEIHRVLSDPNQKRSYDSSEQYLGTLEFESWKRANPVEYQVLLNEAPASEEQANCYSYFLPDGLRRISAVEEKFTEPWYRALLEALYLSRVESPVRIYVDTLTSPSMGINYLHHYNYPVFSIPFGLMPNHKDIAFGVWACRKHPEYF